MRISTRCIQHLVANRQVSRIELKLPIDTSKRCDHLLPVDHVEYGSIGQRIVVQILSSTLLDLSMDRKYCVDEVLMYR